MSCLHPVKPTAWPLCNASVSETLICLLDKGNQALVSDAKPQCKAECDSPATDGWVGDGVDGAQ